ncbi:MAG: DNA translocase FtsK [Acidobacteriota bacterium]|nr:DNA translocase FtsK [Blastocatellia bacterium]MDW8411116.1 DNA translocase FtsK [Acidobacteriota bacterium]
MFNYSDTSRVSEIFGILLIAISLILLLSLVSYEPTDPSWNVSSVEVETVNWIGSLGAWMADAFLQIFGLSAFLIPLILITVGWRTLRQHKLIFLQARLWGVTAIVVSVAGLLSLPQMPLYKDNIRLGGLVGYLLARFFEQFLNKTGAAIVFVLFLLLALMLTTRLSINTILDAAITRSFLQIIVSLELGFRHWLSEQVAALKQRLRELKAKRAERRATASQHMSTSRNISQSVRNVAATLANDGGMAATANPSEGQTQAAASLLPEQIISSKSGRNLKELQRIVYGEPETQTTLREFSITEAVRQVSREVGPERTKTSANQTTHTMQEAALQDFDFANLGSSASDTRKVDLPKSASDTRKISRNSASQASHVEEQIPIGKMEAVPELLSESKDMLLPRIFPEFDLPPSELLREAPQRLVQDESELWERARVLAEKCKEFSVTGKIQHISPGPVVTTFEFKPDPGVKYSRITSLADDLCLALKAESIRIDRIPGKSTVGIEVPNVERETIYLRELIESDKYLSQQSPLTLALGKTIDGTPYVADLTKMPHLLIAGATGTGKSVCLNSLIVSILCKASPDEVKMIMVDPKRLELGLYEGIPHLLTPIVLEPKRAANALKWAVGEMENRYKLLAGYGVRNIDQYNQMVRTKHEIIPVLPPELLPKPLSYIVIVIDELADLMMVASNDVETAITRLAQMARAVGIHLIIATQRPSVDVITGLIKANFPSRISFRVSSKVDSRTILDANGAETLLGQGDMLFLPPGTSRLVRVHGAYVSEEEIGRIVKHIKAQRRPNYDDSIQSSDEETKQLQGNVEKDELYEEALRIVCQMGRASTSVLQRRLRIGYGRAAAILDMMEREGYVGPPDGSKPRVVKREAYEFLERLDQMKVQ